MTFLGLEQCDRGSISSEISTSTKTWICSIFYWFFLEHSLKKCKITMKSFKIMVWRTLHFLRSIGASSFKTCHVVSLVKNPCFHLSLDPFNLFFVWSVIWQVRWIKKTSVWRLLPMKNVLSWKRNWRIFWWWWFGCKVCLEHSLVSNFPRSFLIIWIKMDQGQANSSSFSFAKTS